MKHILLFAFAAIALVSCEKQAPIRNYQCTIETWTPRGVANPYMKRIVPFSGTNGQMLTYQATNTWTDTISVPGDAPYGSWQTCVCR